MLHSTADDIGMYWTQKCTDHNEIVGSSAASV